MSKKKKILISLLSVGAALVITAVVLLCVFLINRPEIELSSIHASEIDDSTLRVEWNTSPYPDKVEIEVSVVGGNSNKYVLSNGADLAKGYFDVTNHYGRNSVKLTAYYKSAKQTKETVYEKYADEYVIAPLVATAPVSIFTLQLKEISENYTIPTFIWLQRGAAWDYTQMPENVFLIPNAQIYDIADIGLMYNNTAKWVKELYELNPDSKFHFYYNDYWPQGWLDATYKNKLPKDSYDVTLLSDGTASASTFTKNFNDPATFEATYAKLANEYTSYTSALSEGKNKKLPRNIAEYVLCMLKEEPNVKLWLLRDWISLPGVGVEPNAIQSEIISLKESEKITNVSLNNLLTALSSDEQAALKKLYKFSDDMFAKATTEGKKVMVILGTSVSGEENFNAYVKATMAYYGDEYVYYYKGHPGYPVALYPERLENRQNLGLIDVEASIAAELIFFFNPNVVTTGYASTTFDSLRTEQVGGILNTKLSNVSASYIDKVEFALYKVDSNDAKYGSLANNKTYVFEFKNTENYEFAIYDEGANTIKYYKTQGSSFVEVQK